MQWSIPAEGLGYNRAYSFAYDGLNRLTVGNYTGGTTGAYNETFEYDKMGNITTFVRHGLQSTTPGVIYSTIDDLKLDHTGNQLTKVTEYGYGKYLSDNIYYGDEEFVQNTANTGNSSAYDANGNRLYDSNSNIWKINYNVLNLPDAMQFYYKHRTYYTYSASGVKLKVVDKTAVDGPPLPVSNLNSMPSDITFSSTTTTDYVGNYIYEDGSLTRILLPEGYYQNGAYFYYLKDHLGSNRVVVQNKDSVVETSSYYPSGMRFGESIAASHNSVQPYRHTGHEMQAMHGLNWIDNNARFRTVSDGAGFTGVDPLAEKHYDISPYAYCANNPISLIDPDGMDWVYHVVNGITEVYYDRDVKSQDDVANKYGKDSGINHMSDGSTLTTYDKDGNITSKYTFTNDAKNNKYGTVADINGDKLDNTPIRYGSNYTIFGTSDNSCNAETLYKNLMGTSYTGPNNPQDYNNNDSYQYMPRNASEYPAIIHDLMYDDKKAKGISGALTNTNVLSADNYLTTSEYKIAQSSAVPVKDRARAVATAVTFTYISVFKEYLKGIKRIFGK